MAYGHRSIPAPKGLNRAIDPEQAAIVRRIFDDYAAGLSPRRIAAKLNAESIPSPSGGKWNDSTIRGNARKRDGMLRNEAYVGILVYGRNRFIRDSDTARRISRPAEAENVVYGEAPELAIIADDVWNAVQQRLERTHSEFAGKGAPLNQSHRAGYLLNGLLRCGCCGGGFTIIGKDRYGCYRRKTQGKQECANSRTVSRQKLEDRVLDRLRQGLVTPAFAARFAAEVERLTLEGAQETDGRKGTIQASLAKVDAAIERLLDRLETGEPGEALLERLRAREAERDALRADLARTVPEVKLPSKAELEAIYRSQVDRLGDLLTGSDQMPAANALLRELVGEAKVFADPQAAGDFHVEFVSKGS